MTLLLNQRTEMEGLPSTLKKEGAYKDRLIQQIADEVESRLCSATNIKCPSTLESFCE